MQNRHLRRRSGLFSLPLLGLSLLCFATPVWASVDDYFDMAPEQLLDAEVMSVSKRSETVSTAPAAVYVITHDDIARAGVLTIPDALRMAPGVQVAQADSNSWAISIRGQNSILANKILVMIDGRTVYNPLFAGTYWEAQDVMMEDIDRIEVIRGPGGTLWGANAVNGVINIITRKTSETEGNLITAGYGMHEQGFTSARHGGSFGRDNYYRVYGKAFNRDNYVSPAGVEGVDNWNSGRAGFRMDWSDDFTLQGDAYQTKADQMGNIISFTAPFSTLVNERVTYQGANMLVRWKKDLSNGAQFTLQSYLDYTRRNEPMLLDDKRVIFDTESQYDFAQIGAHSLTTGLGYRFVTDNENAAPVTFFNPDEDKSHLFSTFIQDKITLSPNKWYLTVGTKLEHNDFSGFEVQPNARLQWFPDEKQSVWTSVSRAVRIPSRLEQDVFLTAIADAGNRYTIVGNSDFDSEELIAYEIGYRNQITQAFSIDTAAYFNDYDKLAAFNTLTPFVVNDGVNPPYLFRPYNYLNAVEGQIYGFELTAGWNIRRNWKLSANYSYNDINLHSDNANLVNPEADENGTPHHQASLRSNWDVNEKLSLNTSLYYVGEMNQNNTGDYVRVDMNLGWKINDSMQFNLVGQNLLEDRHREYGSSTGINATEIERSIFAKLTWQF